MRSAALLLSLCCAAGVAQAAPASDADVAAVVKTLGMGSLGATMASLVWVMALTAAAVGVGMTLAWQPHWLRVLSPWVRTRRG